MIWKCAQGHINMEDENGCQKCNSSLYGHSVAVADEICRRAIKDWDDTGKLLVSRGIMADLIQTAIDEATSALRAQLAERDAQLAAALTTLDKIKAELQFEVSPLRSIAKIVTNYFKDRATRQPTQDKGE